MSSSSASSDALPPSTPALASGSSRENSLYLKRGASVSALSMGDPTQPSEQVEPIAATKGDGEEGGKGDEGAGAQYAAQQPSEQSEGGPLIDAFDDFKAQTWSPQAK